ncbi:MULTISPECIES: hypothetical protein [Paracoccaceae]|uniref:hypothetical protein n=1 Tax=Paracoccaceae TaxID=31989 RepID=UPI001573F5F4|nr:MULTISPECIES: hypothetical protein [Paracoccaceae]MBJ2153097.1 hypothetical protein [Paracoccus sp. IB05]NTT88204.1 hypothetical protein [Tabrizicola sp. SY72]
MLRDHRPDLVFVVTGEVWLEFLRVREETGDALCLGFLQTCEAHMKEAEDAGDDERLWHWRAVMSLGCQYGLSFVSAVEVDGEVMREMEKTPIFTYPNDADLTRVVIDGKQLDYVALRSDVALPFFETIATREPDHTVRITHKTDKEQFYTVIAEADIAALNAAILRHMPIIPVKFAADTLVLLREKFTAQFDDAEPHQDVRAFMTAEGIPYQTSGHSYYIQFARVAE